MPNAITAHHEAGHAVAEVMRGGTVTSISIEPVAGRYEGITWSHGQQWDAGFVIYAGPWAEARAGWSGDDISGVDDDGCTFADDLAGALLLNQDDCAAFERWEHWNYQGFSPVLRESVRAGCEEIWPRELERVWPVIQHVAQLLLASDSRLDSGESATALIHQLLNRDAVGEVIGSDPSVIE